MRGELLEKQGATKVLVRMAPYCRAQRGEAEQVVRELKAWLRTEQAPRRAFFSIFIT